MIFGYVVEIRDGTKMEPEPNGHVEPLCMFGPGGDFVAHWQPELIKTCELSNPLVRLFAAAVEVVAVILGVRRSDACVCLENSPGLNEPANRHKEKIVNAVENNEARDTTDSSPASAPEDGGVLPGEPMLFPNLRRDGLQIEPKPKHRIRAYHRAAKKGSALRLAKQGTLFDVDFASARIA
jgi:hypothetical protein